LGASSSISTGVLVGCPPCSRWNSNFPKKRPPLGASSSISTGGLVGCPPCSRWNSNFQQNGLPWERRVPSRRARLSAGLLVRGGTRTSPQNGLPWERRVPSRRALLSAAPCSRWNSNFPGSPPGVSADVSLLQGELRVGFQSAFHGIHSEVFLFGGNPDADDHRDQPPYQQAGHEHPGEDRYHADQLSDQACLRIAQRHGQHTPDARRAVG